MSRYARQMLLPEVGAEGQARLTRAHVLVIGAGGLGTPVLQYLAGAGVGQITVMDPDYVEESNLHRQPLFTMADIGRCKVDAARDRLMASNPDLKLRTRPEALTAANATQAVAAADLVLDAADSFAASYILSDSCLAQATPLISASVLGQQGYVGGFCGNAPSLRAVFPDLPEQAASCASAGVMGPVVGSIGALQAQMALKVILQHAPSPLGQLMQLNMVDLSLGGFRFDTAQEPEASLRFISPALIQPGSQVIDLRPPHEVSEPVAATVWHVLPQDIDLVELSSTQPIVLCCNSGVRAWRVARKLQEQGFDRLEILAAGTTA